MSADISNVFLDLDEAWQKPREFNEVDLREWGPQLRYHGTRADIEIFYRKIEPDLTPFILYGSGDFHYLAGVLLRRISTRVAVVSFDNHPDWDIRPPHWACGGWVNRALELPNVQRVSVWGCGNFELTYPSLLFANRRALKNKTLEVHAWAERQSPAVQRRFNCMTRDNWRSRFHDFVDSLAGQDVYVTVDLDCLRQEEAITNWENGLFAADDIAWALRTIRSKSRVIAGDLCGAWSQPSYARWFQRFAGNWDHPKLPDIDPEHARTVNSKALATIWPALTGQTT